MRWVWSFLGVVVVCGFVYLQAFRSVASVPDLTQKVAQGDRDPVLALEQPEPIVSKREEPRATPSNVLSGRVLDARGAPCPDADVRFVWREHGRPREEQRTTDFAGSFRFELPHLEVRGTLFANSSACCSPALLADVAAGSDVVLRLAEQRTFEVELLDPLGERLEPTTLDIFWVIDGLTVRGDTPEAWLWRVPPVPFRMHATATGTDAGWFGPFDPEQIGKVLELRTRRLPRIRGRVEVDGKPVMGAEVKLEPLEGGVGGIRRPPFGLRTWSDREGRFELVTGAVGSFLPRAHFTRTGSGRAAPVSLDGTNEPPEIVIELTEQPGTIAGQVLLPPGHAFSEVRVAEVDDSRGRSLRSDGTFELPGIEAGACVLTVFESLPRLADREHEWTTGLSGRPGWLAQEYFFPVEVAAGGTTRTVLDLTRLPSCRIEGRIDLGTSVNGPGIVHVGAARLTLKHATEQWVAARCSLDATQPFEVGVEQLGPYRLELLLGFPETGPTWSVYETLELAPGTRSFMLVLPTGALRLVPPDEDHALPRELFLRWRQGNREINAYSPTVETEHGSLLFAHVPPGPVEIVLPDRSVLCEASVEAGKLTEFTIPGEERVHALLEPFLTPLPDPRESTGYY